MLKSLLNFIGRTNVLLSSRNQEVSLLWVYMALQHMRAQGYFAQLKVRWNYNLNFSGHALLKLEYEAEQEPKADQATQAQINQTSSATALDSNQKLSAYSARTAVYTPYTPTEYSLLSAPNTPDAQPAISRAQSHTPAAAAKLASASVAASTPASATANVTTNTASATANAAATSSSTAQLTSPHASPDSLQPAAPAQASSLNSTLAPASWERAKLTHSAHVPAQMQAQTLPQPQIQVQTQEQAKPQANPQSQAQGTVILVLNSLGLGSLDGPLPLEMTQLIHHLREDENVRLNTEADLTTEQGLVSFLDLISARMFYYFEQVLGRSSMAAQLMQPQAPLNYLLLSLTGNNSNLSPMQLKAALPLLIGPQQRSAEALKLLLAKLLHLPVEIKPFEFAMYPIPRQMRSRLLPHSCVLGGNIQLGAHYATFNRKFSVRLGPMSFEQFSRLHPNQAKKHSNQIQALCEMVLKRPLDCSIVYLIETKTIPRLSLGHAAAQPIALFPDANTAAISDTATQDADTTSELNAPTATTDADTASKLNAPTATTDAAAKANAEVKLKAKAAHQATSSSTLSNPSTMADATLAKTAATLRAHVPLPKANLRANMPENQTDLPASNARTVHTSTAPAPLVAQACSDQNGSQLKVGLGQGLILRNSHTLPVLGLVRQRIHPHPH